jgi:hypothetical protein
MNKMSAFHLAPLRDRTVVLPSKNMVGLIPLVCKDDCTRATSAADVADHKPSSHGSGIFIS